MGELKAEGLETCKMKVRKQLHELKLPLMKMTKIYYKYEVEKPIIRSAIARTADHLPTRIRKWFARTIVMRRVEIPKAHDVYSNMP